MNLKDLFKKLTPVQESPSSAGTLLVRKKLCEMKNVTSADLKSPGSVSPKSRSSDKKRNNKLTPVKLDYKVKGNKMSRTKPIHNPQPPPQVIELSPSPPLLISDDSDEDRSLKRRLHGGSISDPILISSGSSASDDSDFEPPSKRSKVEQDHLLPSYAHLLYAISRTPTPETSPAPEPPPTPKPRLKLSTKKKAVKQVFTQPAGPPLKPLVNSVVKLEPNQQPSRFSIKQEPGMEASLNVKEKPQEADRVSEVQVLLWKRCAGHFTKVRHLNKFSGSELTTSKRC